MRIVLSGETGAGGERSLDLPTAACDEAVAATALAIALMIDPTAGQKQPTPAPEQAAGTGVQAPAVTTAAGPDPAAAPGPSLVHSVRVREESFETHWRTRFALAAVVAVGSLPGGSAGAEVGLNVYPAGRHAGVDLAIGYLASRKEYVRSGAGAEFGWHALRASAFWTPWRRARSALSLLAGCELSHRTANGFGFRFNGSDNAWVAAGSVQVELAWSLNSHFELYLRPGLAVPFGRDTFEVSQTDAPTAIFRPAVVAGTLSAAVAFSP